MLFQWKIWYFVLFNKNLYLKTKFSLFLMIFMKICNFSIKDTKRECTSIKNSVIFHQKLISLKIYKIWMKQDKRYKILLENLIFGTGWNNIPFTFGDRPEFSFELK